jgi:hypothetical protein
MGDETMGLYLCIFSDGHDRKEIAGWQLGHYSDFGCFRDAIARHLGMAGFPILMEHSDCDGEWSVAQLPGLVVELETIAAIFRALPPEEPKGAFEHTVEDRKGARITSAFTMLTARICSTRLSRWPTRVFVQNGSFCSNDASSQATACRRTPQSRLALGRG